ncbi:hypothetical protein GCM10022224_089040 [Nonomuraea antimicrobica]|uniref:Orc1-like AAA ATPase domain-containing protein n=1 Tax=Nonomuraea antimicrobica TaxID=561173 RepID=A0ABP7DVM1_9ACTN
MMETADHNNGAIGRVQAFDGAQQAVQGLGTQNNYFYARTSGGPERKPFTIHAPPNLIGRSAEMARLKTLAASEEPHSGPVILTIHGMAGVGKTALMRVFAQQLQASYPDACIEVDLQGFTPGKEPRRCLEVLAELLALVGFQGTDIPSDENAAAQLWRSWLAGRRVLICLDNARDPDQVELLLPGVSAKDCLVLISSRQRLGRLNAQSMHLKPLEEIDAVELLVGKNAAGREDRDTLADVAAACGFLPLAIRAVGVLLEVAKPRDVLATMREASNPFHYLPVEERAIRSAFSVSYDALSNDLKSFLRRCAWHDGPNFDDYSMAALTQVPRYIAAARLADLFQYNMLLQVGSSRYKLHDLFLGYVRERSTLDETEDLIGRARIRLYESLDIRLADALAFIKKHDPRSGWSRISPESEMEAIEDARDWLTSAIEEINNVAASAVRDRWEDCAVLVSNAAWWLMASKRLATSRNLYSLLSEIADAENNKAWKAVAVSGLGSLSRARNELQEAEDYYSQALDLFHDLRAWVNWANVCSGLAEIAFMRGGYDLAENLYREAIAIFTKQLQWESKIRAIQGLGAIAFERGDYATALERCSGALAFCKMVDDRFGEAQACSALGSINKKLEKIDEALHCYNMARNLFEEMGLGIAAAGVTVELADLNIDRKEHSEAERLYSEAARTYASHGEIRGELEAHYGVGRVAYDQEDFGAAITVWRRSAELARDKGEMWHAMKLTFAVGAAHESIEEIEEAVACYLEAESWYRANGFQEDASECEQALARTLKINDANG